MRMKKILQGLSMVAALLAAQGVSTFVLAQQSDAQAQKDTVQADQDKAQALKANTQEYMLTPITVTATRRAENLQKVSRPIVAIDNEALIRNGVTDALELPALVPGLTIAENAYQLQVSIRGVGDRTVNPGTEPGILFSLDGAYMTKSYDPLGSFFDLQRVEVLKGPQGTLYGRNAAAGAVNLIAVKPKSDFGGFAQVEAGNYSLYRFTGALNVPLNDTVAARLSTQLTDRDGYLSDVNNDDHNDDKSRSVRLQVLYEPNDSTSLLVSGNYYHRGGIGSTSVIAERFGSTPSITTVPNPSDHWAGPTQPATLDRLAATNLESATLMENYWSTRYSYEDLDVYVASATFEHSMDWGSITVIPSLVSSEVTSENGLVSVQHNTDKDDQYALEARVASPDDARIKWVFGGYGSQENQSHTNQQLIAIAPGFDFNSVTNARERDTSTWAVFGSADSDLTDSLHLVTGLRYSEVSKNLRGYGFNYGFLPGENAFASYPFTDATIPGPDYPGVLILNGDQNTDELNYHVSLSYDLTEASMLYASVATGFKAGGFFDSPIETDNTFKSEKLTAYTVGSKNRFVNNRWQVNAEGFYWDYKDKQEGFVAFVPAAMSALFMTRNAGKATLYGLDLSVSGLITAQDLVTVELEYLHTKYDTFQYFIEGPSDNAEGYGCTLIDTVQDGIAGYITDCSGYPLIRAPEWSGRLGYTRTQPMGEKGTVIFTAHMNYSDNYYMANNFTDLEIQPAFETYEATLTWQSASTKWSVTGWGKNLTEENVYTGGPGQTPALLDAVNAEIAPPRTFGVRLRYEF